MACNRVAVLLVQQGHQSWLTGKKRHESSLEESGACRAWKLPERRYGRKQRHRWASPSNNMLKVSHCETFPCWVHQAHAGVERHHSWAWLLGTLHERYLPRAPETSERKRLRQRGPPGQSRQRRMAKNCLRSNFSEQKTTLKGGHQRTPRTRTILPNAGLSKWLEVRLSCCSSSCLRLFLRAREQIPTLDMGFSLSLSVAAMTLSPQVLLGLRQ